MRFSIIIPTFNRAELVERCVENNLKEAGVERSEIEVIWVDDGSTDNVREVMRRFNPDISILKSKNEGVFKAYNAGYVLATGDWMVRLGSDMMCPQNWLARIKEYIEKVPETAGVGLLIENFFDGSDGWSCKEGETRNGMPILKAKHFMGVYAFSKELFKEVGYFDEDFGWYGPGDWDWSDRAINTGKLLYYIPDLRVKHLGENEWNLDVEKKRKLTSKGDKILEKKRKESPNRTYYSPFI